MMIKRIIVLSCAFVLVFNTDAWAQQSPEMAKTAEQWAALRDDNLDFSEISELVHEYNPTVLQNAVKYRNEKNQSSTDIAQSYYDAASNIAENMNEPDTDSANYAQAVSSYLNSQIQYENLMKQGDTNTNDSETIKLNYDKAEAELVKQAQTLMINYWTQAANIASLEANLAAAQANANTANDRYSAGMALSSDIASALQNVTQAEAQLLSARSSLESTKEQLCLMLGWSYGANVNIGQVPSISDEEIAAINLASDIVTAKDNNYSYQITLRQYSNASYASKEQLAQTKASAEQNIANNVSSLYNALMLAQSNYAQAAGSSSIQNSALAAAARKLKAGLITQKAYNQAAAGMSSSDSSLESKRLALVSAYNNYKWAVNGLAQN